MPFGDHWEWRGFGTTPVAFRTWFQTLPLLYPPSPQPLRDDYLWTEGCRHNVKLRDRFLKFKRFLERRGDFERWLEREDEYLPFPLQPDHLQTLARLLHIRLPTIPQAPISRDQLLSLLAQAQPPVQILTVLKQRRLARWSHGDTTIIIEWTRIRQPQAIETVALEHPDWIMLQQAHQALLPHLQSLQPLNYLQALRCWAQDCQLPHPVPKYP